MSKYAWSFLLSTAFAIALTFTPVPEQWRMRVVIAAWLICAIATAGWVTAHLLSQRRPEQKEDLLIKIRDLILSTAAKPLNERVDVIGALIRFSSEFKSEKQVVWTLNQLEQRRFPNPFKILESTTPRFFEGRKLQFLREARTARIEIRLITSACSFAIKYWSRASEYGEARQRVSGYAESKELAQKPSQNAMQTLQPSVAEIFEDDPNLQRIDPKITIANAAKTSESHKRLFYSCLEKIRQGTHPLKAMQEARVHEFDTNDDLLRFCDDLVTHGASNPCADLPIPREHWLGFFKMAVGRDLSTGDGMLAVLDDIQRLSVGDSCQRTPITELLNLFSNQNPLRTIDSLHSHHGRSITVQGKLVNINPLGKWLLTLISIPLEDRPPALVSCRFDRDKWQEAFRDIYEVGDAVTVNGKVSQDQNGQSLQLSECEIEPAR